MRSLAICFCVAVLAVLFMACGSDENDNKVICRMGTDECRSIGAGVPIPDGWEPYVSVPDPEEPRPHQNR